MTKPAGAPRVPPWGMALASMFSVQLGSALSVHLIATVGPAGAAWLRITVGALVFVAWTRPPLRSVRKRDLVPLLSLGVINGLATASFMAAIARIPLGTTVAIEFLGPMTVAAARGNGRRALVWPGLALVGVALLTEPWQGSLNLPGLGFAAFAGVGWGAYVLFTQRIGDRFAGVAGLSLTMPIAAVASAVFGIPEAAGHLGLSVIATAVGLAVLFPVLPYALEMHALRHMTHNAFGTLMALEPAFGTILGLIVLHQQPSPIEVIGVLLVVFAGAAAQRGGLRRPRADETVSYQPSE